MENLYEILEVSKNASQEVIEKAYKTLAKKYHPDISEDKVKAEKMMKKLNSAYEILSNPKTREEYDYNLKQDELNNSNIQKEIREEENKVSYNEYYDIKKEQTETNMYNNYYEQENDYANNFNLFKRIRNIQLDKNTKIFLLIILFIIVLLIFKLFSIIGEIFRPIENEPINSGNNNQTTENKNNKPKDEEYEINDNTPINLVYKLIEDLKRYDFQTINTYVTDVTKISLEKLNTLEMDKEIYEYIINNSEYIIHDYKVTNKKAEINIRINTFDVENAKQQYLMEKLEDFTMGNNEQEVEKIVKYLKENINNKITKDIKIIVFNTDNGWKIYLNVYDILGTNIL